jgi:DNA-binding XRE family transcriptional regulator
VRPSVDQVLLAVTELTGIDRSVILGPRRSHVVIDARAVAAYVLRTAAGLSALEVGQLLARSADTVRDVTRRPRNQTPRAARRGKLVAQVRRLLALHEERVVVDARPLWPRAASGLLYGLQTAREVARLNRKELGARVGMARETISRLEHLHRATNLRALQVLAAALDVSPDVLTRSQGVR